MDVIKKMRPGEPGTKRLHARFGDQLVCVRYRNDSANQRRLTTVELIVDEGFHLTDKRSASRARQSNNNRNVLVRIDYHETELRQQARQVGGRWQPEHKRWILRYRDAKKMGLDDRIEEINNVEI